MTNNELASLYHEYIACINRQDWLTLEGFLDDQVKHNGESLRVRGYRQMLERDFAAIPDLSFHIDLLVTEPPFVASRLRFDCTPAGRFLGLDVCGQKVTFTENVFYEFAGGKILHVWSVIDKTAIEAQLSSPAHPSTV